MCYPSKGALLSQGNSLPGRPVIADRLSCRISSYSRDRGMGLRQCKSLIMPVHKYPTLTTVKTGTDPGKRFSNSPRFVEPPTIVSTGATAPGTKFSKMTRLIPHPLPIS